jgi:hypothetical protein
VIGLIGLSVIEHCGARTYARTPSLISLEDVAEGRRLYCYEEYDIADLP